MEFEKATEFLSPYQIGINTHKWKAVSWTVVEEFIVRVEPVISCETELRVPANGKAWEVVIAIGFDVVLESDDTVK